MTDNIDQELYNKYRNDSVQPGKNPESGLGLIWQLDSEPLMLSIMLMLNGYAYDVTTKEMEKVSEPLMNKEGMLAIQTIVAPLIDKHTILGNLDEKLFNEICQDASFDLLELVYTEDDKYGIKEGNGSRIYHTLSSAINAIMTRPLGGKDRETARAIMRIDLSRQISENAKSEGFWTGLRQKVGLGNKEKGGDFYESRH